MSYDGAVITEASGFAFSADDAFAAVRHRLMIPANADRALRAYSRASAASGALGAIDLEFLFKTLCLRIMAPEAPQMTALEEYCRPDAVAVMY